MRCGIVVWIFALGCSAPSWDPPPTDAVDSCAFEYHGSLAVGVKTSTLWLNAAGQIIQADGDTYDGESIVPASSHYTYDDQGRLIDALQPEWTSHYEYMADRIVETMNDGVNEISLVDGRVVHEVDTFGSTSDYSYDAQGRVLVWSTFFASDGHTDRLEYTYDANGRASQTRRYYNGRPTVVDIVQTQTADRLVMQITGDPQPRVDQIIFELDTSGRVTRSAAINSGGEVVSTYRYEDRFIEERTQAGTITASGQCEPPRIRTSHEAPLPFIANPSHLGFYQPAYVDTFELF